MKTCKGCGNECRDEAVFCPECGVKLDEAAAEQESTQTEQAISQEAEKAGQTEAAKPNKKSTKTLAVVVPIVIVAAVILIILISVFLPRILIAYNARRAMSRLNDIVVESDEVYEADEPDERENIIDVSRIDSIIDMDENNADFSVYIVDLENDKTYGTANSSSPMSASALINIPIMYTVAGELDSDMITWSSQVEFLYLFSGRGNIKQEQSGNLYSMEYLVEQMLNYSDNNATNSLMNYFGSEYVNSFCRRNSYSSVDIQRYLGETSEYKDNYVSARDISEMLAELYNAPRGSAVGKDYLLSNFYISDDIKYDGAGRNIPYDAVFLNHNGVTSTIYNETAIVIDDDAEYIITILSNNGNTESSAKTATKISDYVYAALTR